MYGALAALQLLLGLAFHAVLREHWSWGDGDGGGAAVPTAAKGAALASGAAVELAPHTDVDSHVAQ